MNADLLDRTAPRTCLLIVARTLLHLLFLNLPLQIMRQILLLPNPRHDPRRMREHIIHLLKRHLLRLREQRPKEERIREIANHKQKIIPVMDVPHRDGRHLSNHGIERERGHSGNRDTLRPCSRVKHFCWDNPRQGTAGRREGEVVEPGHDDEAPVGAGVVCCWGKLGEQDCGDDEGYAVA